LIKELARCFVIPRAIRITATVPISFERSVSRNAPGLAPLIKGERKMKKTILTLAGSALIALQGAPPRHCRIP